MKVLHPSLFPGWFAIAALLCFVVTSTLAQAPAGPQGSAQQPGAAPAPAEQAQPAQQPPPPAAQKPSDAGATIAVQVPVVTMDVLVTTQKGDLITGLKKENFRVLDNGVPQAITSFGSSDAPMTTVMLVGFSGGLMGNISSQMNDWFAHQVRYWAEPFFTNLQQKDWVALVTFDLKTHTEIDFTQNKEDVEQALMRLRYPGFAETNVFDAILDTNDRMHDVKGKKSIIVLATGVDTFSKHTYDQTMKALRQSDISLFCIGFGKVYSNYLDTHGMLGSHMNYLQGENQLRTFSQLTGGMSFFPQFEGEMPAIFHDITAFLRNQYSLSYTPSIPPDGKFHNVKIEAVLADGTPLLIADKKNKKQKVVVYSRQGYTAEKFSAAN